MRFWSWLFEETHELLDGPLGGLIAPAEGMARAAQAVALDASTKRDRTKSAAFTIGVIALSAKMAKADGTVSASEILAFREIFTFDPAEQKHVEWVFDRARRDTLGYQLYARQLAHLMEDDRDSLIRLLEGLVHIAKADGVVSDSEVAYLAEVARIFGLSDEEFDAFMAKHVGLDAELAEAYAILGVDASANEAELKRAYHNVVRDHHPDHAIGAGLPASEVAQASTDTAAITAAWQLIRSARGL